MKVVNVIIEVQGGLIQGISADGRVRCVVVDHDTDGVNKNDLSKFPLSKRQTKSVIATDWEVDHSAGFVKHALKTLGL